MELFAWLFGLFSRSLLVYKQLATNKDRYGATTFEAEPYTAT